MASKSQKSEIGVHVVTWNLGNTNPPTKTWNNDAAPWNNFVSLNPPISAFSSNKIESASNKTASASTDFKEAAVGRQDQDLVIFSFQEIDRHVLEGGEEPWTSLLTAELTSDSEFVRLAAVR